MENKTNSIIGKIIDVIRINDGVTNFIVESDGREKEGKVLINTICFTAYNRYNSMFLENKLRINDVIEVIFYINSRKHPELNKYFNDIIAISIKVLKKSSEENKNEPSLNNN